MFISDRTLFPIFPLTDEETRLKRGLARKRIQDASLSIDSSGFFSNLSKSDMKLIFETYDEIFLGGFFNRLGKEINFEFSSRMSTSAGALHLNKRSGKMCLKLSAQILLANFAKDTDSVMVNGIKCHDRLEAAMVVVEHEIIHALEFAEKGKSSCKGKHFMELANGFFGHSSPYHNLKTTSSRRKIIRPDRPHSFNVGDSVSFFFRGQWLKGEITRITKRATVMMKCLLHKAHKYYVPLEHLHPDHNRV